MATKRNPSSFYVYALLDTRKPGKFRYGHWVFDFEPFYLGKGTKGRYADHISPSHLDPTRLRKGENPHKRNKICRILKQGFEIGTRILRIFDIEEDAFELEVKLISKIGRCDLKTGPLVNKTSGGEGTCGRVCKDGFTKAHRRKLSECAKRQHESLTEEDRKVISKKIKQGLSSIPMKEQERLNASRAEKVRKYWADLRKTKSAYEKRKKNMSNGITSRSDADIEIHRLNRISAQQKRRRAES